MNTRLLMILRVTVATPQNIAVVPHGDPPDSPHHGGQL